MRLTFIIAVICILLALLLPLLISHDAPAEPEPTPEPVGQTGRAEADGQISFTVLNGGAPETVTMAEYLPGVVAGEMPALFGIEALKAQAVAARTFILYRIEHRNPAHPEAAVCGDPGCCLAHSDEQSLRSAWGDDYSVYMSLMALAVGSTDGEYLSWEGEPIQALFHSSSAGRTEDSAAVWGELPYLVGVSSPETAEDVPNYVTTAVFSPEELFSLLSASYPAAIGGGDPAGWLGEVLYDDSGRVAAAELCGLTLSGAELRQIFSLRSAAFTLACTEGRFVFTVTGFGHGVGMSQYGARVMADAGSGYREILAHYYSGAELVTPG